MKSMLGRIAQRRAAPSCTKRPLTKVPRTKLLLATLLLAIAPAQAAPPTPADIATICASAEDQSHCGRLVEAWQMPRLPGLATRDGDELRVALYPSGAATFRDESARQRRADVRAVGLRSTASTAWCSTRPTATARASCC